MTAVSSLQHAPGRTIYLFLAVNGRRDGFAEGLCRLEVGGIAWYCGGALRRILAEF
jgi:hypothetical protein